MQHFKMSTSRDFRINAASLQVAMDQAAEETDGDDDDSDDQVAVSLSACPSTSFYFHNLLAFCYGRPM